MRTSTRIHTHQEQRMMRIQGDRRARQMQVQFLCCVSMVRCVVMQMLPLCGSALWWVAPLCMAPGIVVYLLISTGLKRSGAATVQAATAKAGKVVRWITGGLVFLLLMLDGAASMTALITAFTQGIGTEGTQLTLAGLTLLALLGCMKKDGLPWGIYMMRKGLMSLALVIAAVMTSMANVDGIHPVLGTGSGGILAAIRAGAGMAWPLILLTTIEPPRPGIIRPVLPVAAVTFGAGIMLCLVYPCEVLIRSGTMAERLLMPALHLPQALRTLAHSLGMLTLFLEIASVVQLSAERLAEISGRDRIWFPYVIAAALAGTQALDIHRLWRGVSSMLEVLPAGVVVVGIALWLRRKSCAGK